MGCSTKNPNYEPSLQADAQPVDYTDGINADEAQSLGNEYFTQHMGCGVVGDAKDAGDKWELPTFVGYAGKPAEPIQIDKMTGQMSWTLTEGIEEKK